MQGNPLIRMIPSGGPVLHLPLHPFRPKRTLPAPSSPEGQLSGDALQVQQEVLYYLWLFAKFKNEHGEMDQIWKEPKSSPLTRSILETIHGKWLVGAKMDGQLSRVVLTPEFTGILLMGGDNQSSDNKCIKMPSLVKDGAPSCILTGDLIITVREDSPLGKLQYVYSFYCHDVFAIRQKLVTAASVEDWHLRLLPPEYALTGNPSHRFHKFKSWQKEFLRTPATPNVKDGKGNVFALAQKSMTEIDRGGLVGALADLKVLRNDGLVFTDPNDGGISYKLKFNAVLDMLISTLPSPYITAAEVKKMEDSHKGPLPLYPLFEEKIVISKQLHQVPCAVPHAVKMLKYIKMAQVESMDLHLQIQEHLKAHKQRCIVEVQINTPSADLLKTHGAPLYPVILQIRKDKQEPNPSETMVSTLLAFAENITLEDVCHQFKEFMNT
jgi:hypothetical protein